MPRGSLQLTALGSNSMSRPRASNLGAAPLKYQAGLILPRSPSRVTPHVIVSLCLLIGPSTRP